jgi:hypothetical protein
MGADAESITPQLLPRRTAIAEAISVLGRAPIS